MNKLFLHFLAITLSSAYPNKFFAQTKYSSNGETLMKFNNFQNLHHLKEFQLKFDSLKYGLKETVTILHIGDSHLQGDFSSRTIRYKLQYKFGNKGRGLTFPYSLVKTYGPTDYQISSPSTWDVAKMFPGEKNIPVGLTGYTISTTRDAEFSQSLKHNPNIKWGTYTEKSELPSYKFNFAEIILSYIGETNLTIYAETIDAIIDSFQFSLSKSSVLKDTILNIRLSTELDELKFKVYSKDSNSFRLNIHGIVVQNSLEPGILYHVAGVGACQLTDFLKASRFYKNTVSLKPDLIIFALGANESITKNFDTVIYHEKFARLLSNLKNDIPGVNFIIQTPPDILFHKKSPISIGKVNSVLQSISITQKTGFWDFNSVMGGIGSNQRWYKKGLISNDRIHFKPEGYHIMGLLFLDAFNKAFIPNEIDRINTNDLLNYSQIFFESPTNELDSINYPIKNNITKPKNNKSDINEKNKNPNIYIVRKGDTIYSIAKRNNLSEQYLLKINRLNKRSIIRPGQKIKLK